MKRIFLSLIVWFVSAMPVLAGTSIPLDNMGRIWTAWVEQDGSDTEVYAAYYENNEWSEKQVLTNNTYNEIAPKIAVDSTGTPFVVYCGNDGVSSSIYIVTIDKDGQWTEPAMISDFDAEEDTTPSIMIDKSDNVWVAWADYSGVSDDIAYNVRRNGTWEGQEMASTPNDTPDIYPEIVSLHDGSVCVIWSAFDGISYKLKYRINNGSSWGNSKLVTGLVSDSAEIKPSALNIDGESIVFWSENGQVRNKKIEDLKANVSDKKITGADALLKDLTPFQIEQSAIAWVDDSGASHKILIRYLDTNDIKTSLIASFFKSFVGNNTFLATLFSFLDFSAQEVYAAVDTNRYIAFGDSITYGTFSRTNRGVGGYPAKLRVMLGKHVSNRGVNGERTSSGLSRIASVLRAENAGCLLLMEGTNDVGDGTSAGTIKNNLGAMIDRATAYGTKTILATIIPRRDVFNDRAIELNNHIRALAGEKGVYLVDMYEIFNALDPAVYYGDHLHPTDAGYHVMADNWRAAISNSGNGSSGGGSSDGGGGGGGGCGTIKPNNDQINFNISLLLVILLGCVVKRFRFAKNH